MLVREMFSLMRQHEGFISAELIPPAVPGDEYEVVVRFESEAALNGWDTSDERDSILRRMRHVAEAEPEYRRLTGLEAWFELPVVPASTNPPRAAWRSSPGWAFSRLLPSSSGSSSRR
jgi:antibiotic biosynthesis monooxygenase (ABM) superfamily enzyme